MPASHTYGAVHDLAPIDLARALMAGDAETLRQGYSKENAILAVIEVSKLNDVQAAQLRADIDQSPRPIGAIIDELRTHPDCLVAVAFCNADLDEDTRSAEDIDFVRMEIRMTEVGHDFLV